MGDIQHRKLPPSAYYTFMRLYKEIEAFLSHPTPNYKYDSRYHKVSNETIWQEQLRKAYSEGVTDGMYYQNRNTFMKMKEIKESR